MGALAVGLLARPALGSNAPLRYYPSGTVEPRATPLARQGTRAARETTVRGAQMHGTDKAELAGGGLA